MRTSTRAVVAAYASALEALLERNEIDKARCLLGDIRARFAGNDNGSTGSSPVLAVAGKARRGSDSPGALRTRLWRARKAAERAQRPLVSSGEIESVSAGAPSVTASVANVTASVTGDVTRDVTRDACDAISSSSYSPKIITKIEEIETLQTSAREADVTSHVTPSVTPPVTPPHDAPPAENPVVSRPAQLTPRLREIFAMARRGRVEVDADFVWSKFLGRAYEFDSVEAMEKSWRGWARKEGAFMGPAKASKSPPPPSSHRPPVRAATPPPPPRPREATGTSDPEFLSIMMEGSLAVAQRAGTG